MTNIRVSQEALEVLLTRWPNIRGSQVSIEVLTALFNMSNIRTSQVAIEVLGSSSVEPPVVGRILGPPVQVI